MPESSIFEQKTRIFGLDVGTQNFEVLGEILASILRVLGRSWERLGASWAPLRASWAPLWLQNTYTKAATQHIKKSLKNGVLKTGVGGMKRFVWGYGEMHNSEKSIAKPYGKTPIQRNGVNQGR